MTTLYELNLYAQGALTFTDNRPSDVKFSFPQARNIEKTILSQSFPVEVGIQIIDVLKPVEAKCSYSIDVSTVPGATVTWSVIPSGCSVSVYNQVYTIDGIDSRAIWEQVRYPTITVPVTFFGSFFYYGTISYTNNSIPKTKTWQVGLYVPQSELDAAFTMNCDGSLVSGITKSLPMQTTMTTDTSGIQLVGVAGIYAQFTAGYFSPAASLVSAMSIAEQGEVDNQPMAPILTMNNPNPETTDIKDDFGSDVAVDSSYILVGAKGEIGSTYDYAGKAYVFNKSTGALIYTLSNPSPGPANDYFGNSVAITANYFVVGSPAEINDAFSDGTVYVFNKTNGNLHKTIDNTVTGGGQLFGTVVRTSDYANDLVAVSSPGERKVYYAVDCDAGTIGSSIFQTNLVNPVGPTVANNLDSYGSYWMAGARNVTSGGQAYIYSGGTLQRSINASACSSNTLTNFADSVAVSANYFAISAYDSTEGSYKVFVGRISDGAILGYCADPEIGVILQSSEVFGWRLDMTDDYLFISTERSFKDDILGRIWMFNTTTQTQITGKKIYPPDILSNDTNPPTYYSAFGQSFAYDNNDKLVVGTSVKNEYGQRLFVFETN